MHKITETTPTNPSGTYKTNTLYTARARPTTTPKLNLISQLKRTPAPAELMD